MSDAFIGADPIYKNYAYDIDKPLAATEVCDTLAHEAIAAAWEASLPKKSVDASLNPNAVSSLSVAAIVGNIPPAISVDEDGNTTFNQPVPAHSVTPAMLGQETSQPPSDEGGEQETSQPPNVVQSGSQGQDSGGYAPPPPSGDTSASS